MTTHSKRRLLVILSIAGFTKFAFAMPNIPELRVGGGATESFIAEGGFGSLPSKGFGFRIATDGYRQSIALYDIKDGTPVFISDGNQTLLYDLKNEQILYLPASYAKFSLDHDIHDEKLPFDFGVFGKKDGNKDDVATSWFRFNGFVEGTQAVRLTKSDEGGVTYVTKNENDRIDTLYFPKDSSVSFTLTNEKPSTGQINFQVKMSLVGKHVPATAVTFPKVEALAKQVTVRSVNDPEQITEWAKSVSSLLYLKAAVTGDKAARRAIEATGRTIDWDALSKQDRRLGAAFRNVLRAGDLNFGVPTESPTTRPSN